MGPSSADGSVTLAGRPLVVVGGGAAGLMAAIAAGEAGARNVLVVERTSDGGRKILISGGGRCNVLPSRIDAGDFVTTSSPNSLRRILLAWPLPDQRRWFESTLGIPLTLEASSGKLFPTSNRARDVRDALVARARALGAELRFRSSVENLLPPVGEGAPWTVVLEGGATIPARAVVVASGGLSVPATGSDGTGLRVLEALGHTIHPLHPALTPLTATPPVHRDLAGVSLDVHLLGRRGRERRASLGGFLFTHRGYSGPSVLDLSDLATRPAPPETPPAEFRVRWTGEDAETWDARLQEGSATTVRTVLRRSLPERLADRLCQEAGVDPGTSLARLRREDRRALAEGLGNFPLPWNGSEGYRKAEVTAGGVALAEVDPRTLESRLHPRLFLCGELLDAFGPIGGYNFAWAWSTGRAAGQGAAAGAP